MTTTTRRRTGAPTARRRSSLLVATAALGLALTSCANAETPSDGTAEGTAGAGAGPAAEAATPASSAGTGETCTVEDYGAEQMDLSETVVGFSQSEPESAPFRVAETQSIRDAAEEAGVEELLTTNANNQLSKQVSDIQDMLAQGAELLIVAPLNSDGLEPALAQAQDQGVPVITIDRKLNAEPCVDYVTFLGSDFYDQGVRAAEAMIEATGGEGQVAILLGTSGNNVTTGRTNGFVETLEEQAPDLEVVAQQTGEFSRSTGQQVMEQLLQANSGITAVYAENDEMGLGALTAIQAAGQDPGQDVKIVSVDGTRNAVQAIVDGDYNAVIESNPRFGPLAFSTAETFLSGEAVPVDIIIEDGEYDESNAADRIGEAF